MFAVCDPLLTLFLKYMLIKAITKSLSKIHNHLSFCIPLLCHTYSTPPGHLYPSQTCPIKSVPITTFSHKICSYHNFLPSGDIFSHLIKFAPEILFLLQVTSILYKTLITNHSVKIVLIPFFYLYHSRTVWNHFRGSLPCFPSYWSPLHIKLSLWM